MAKIPDHQLSFLDDIGPYLSALPGGLVAVSKRLSIPLSALESFYCERSSLEEEVFMRLVASVDCDYELLEWPELSTHNHVYTLTGHHTLHPASLDELIKAELCVSGGGDVNAIYEVDCHDQDLPMRQECRFLVVDRHSDLFLFLVDKPEILDLAVAEYRFSRFDGCRVACRELYEILMSHYQSIIADPLESPRVDAEFFACTQLAISQMTIAPPDEHSLGDCYSVGDDPLCS